jgi:hypothetical protein
MSALMEVRDQLMRSGVIRSECEFSEQWLGKSECYVRVLRYSGCEPSADAWANCAAKLGALTKHLSESSDAHHQHWARVFGDLRERCYTEMDARAPRKWRARQPGKGLAA